MPAILLFHEICSKIARCTVSKASKHCGSSHRNSSKLAIDFVVRASVTCYEEASSWRGIRQRNLCFLLGFLWPLNLLHISL